MENIERVRTKIILYSIIISFLCQNAAFCTPERNFILRPPSHFSESTEAIITKQHTIGELNFFAQWLMSRRQFLKTFIIGAVGIGLAYESSQLLKMSDLLAAEGNKDSLNTKMKAIMKEVKDLNKDEVDLINTILSILTVSTTAKSRLKDIAKLIKEKKIIFVKADDVQKIAKIAGDTISKGTNAMTFTLGKDASSLDLFIVVIQKDVFEAFPKLATILSHELFGNVYFFKTKGKLTSPTVREEAEVFAYKSGIDILTEIITIVKERLSDMPTGPERQDLERIIGNLEEALELEKKAYKGWKERLDKLKDQKMKKTQAGASSVIIEEMKQRDLTDVNI